MTRTEYEIWRDELARPKLTIAQRMSLTGLLSTIAAAALVAALIVGLGV